MKQTPNVTEPVEKAHTQKPNTKSGLALGPEGESHPKTSKQVSRQAQPEGTSWQFYFIVAVLLAGVMGLVGKVMGLF